MTDLQIHCDNCGAKYKLPATYTGSQAKCQKCGSVIDVAAQRSTAGVAGSAPSKQPAALAAAAARPAIDRSKERPKADERQAPVTGRRERPARRSSESEAGAGNGKRGRTERNQKQRRSLPIVLGVAGLLAIAVVVAIVMSRG